MIPLGNAVGIKLFADGALVISVNDAESHLKSGDLLLRVNGEKIRSTEFLQDYLQENAAAPVTLTLRRDDRIYTCSVTSKRDDTGMYRIGAWVRDSMAGIGTMTYYDPATGQYGALGHGITDIDTAALMSLSDGSIMDTAIKAVKRGAAGDPGELRGDFTVQRDVGTLTANTAGGVFGILEDPGFVAEDAAALPIASAAEIKTGPATILTTVSGDTPRAYQVEILRLFPGSDTRNMLLQVTDDALLSTTGGIVQGMSGSPILQNGHLVGAVTHVLVDDPTRGYGIFMENMMHMAN